MQKNIRSKKDLEIYLQKLQKPVRYRNQLEQYPTSAGVASEILFLAYLDGNVEGNVIGDFGAGNGIFSVGAALIGAKKVYAVELDLDQADALRKNAEGLNIDIIIGDILSFRESVDTVFMNPPFGSVTEGADRKFLDAAMKLGKHIYSLHNLKSADFIRGYYAKSLSIVRERKFEIQVPRLYGHHTKDIMGIPAVFFHCEQPNQ
ncbi:MAG: METTL5 family protein [Candidatus Thermoplasmatota archaeon]|jgi:putative methylase|nr:METTL5 family protein [Candidatus Thermoplasmatota archaeon]MCL5955263.1 METTL5 family protein [Candidatus Thermoplasmatota archaeon]